MLRALKYAVVTALFIAAASWWSVASAQEPAAVPAIPAEESASGEPGASEALEIQKPDKSELPDSPTPPHRLQRRQKENLRRAEALAHRFVQRLKETMDVEVVYREMVVPNAVWRHRMSDYPDLVGAFSDDLKTSCDDDNLERYALAITNLMWAYAAFLATTQDVTKINDLQPLRDATPPEVVMAASQMKFFSPLAELRLSQTKIETREELLEVITQAQELRQIILKHVPPGGFDSDLYHKNVRHLAKNRKSLVTSDTRHAYSPNEDVEIYTVWADFLPLAIVEHEGELKVLTLGD